MGWTTADIADQSGKRVIVTGANSGIGFHTALELARRGATVVLACRSPQRGQDALERMTAAVPSAEIILELLDLSDLSSIRSFAEKQVAEPLDILVNNAGVMAIPRATTADGFEMQIGTNHLGHFALTGLLLPALRMRPGARVVTVSSFASFIGKIDLEDLNGERKYSKWAAYGQAKLANLLFAKELGRRVEDVTSVAAHPGYAATSLMGNTTKVGGTSKIMELQYRLGSKIFAQSEAAGALPSLLAAVDPRVKDGEVSGPLLVMRGAPRKSTLSPRGNDREVARRLWDLSEKLTGVSYP